MGIDAPTAEPEDDPAYHLEFIRQMRMTEQLQQISKDKNYVNFDEDDDKFFSGLNTTQDNQPDTSTQKFDLLDPNEKRKVDKKSLKNIDTTPIEYEAIRKNLYIESREISLMTEKEVAEYRKKNGDIKVRGIQCPKPIKSWYQCGLPSTVLEQLERKKFETPFPIQF